MRHVTQMERALDFLMEGPKSVHDIAAYLERTTKSAGQTMRRLIDSGRVEYLGNSRDGIYAIPGYHPLPKHCPRIGLWGL